MQIRNLSSKDSVRSSWTFGNQWKQLIGSICKVEFDIWGSINLPTPPHATALVALVPLLGTLRFVMECPWLSSRCEHTAVGALTLRTAHALRRKWPSSRLLISPPGMMGVLWLWLVCVVQEPPSMTIPGHEKGIRFFCEGFQQQLFSLWITNHNLWIQLSNYFTSISSTYFRFNLDRF